MARIVDRRLDGKHKSASNRKRLLRRYKAQIRKAVSDAVSRRSITDVDKGEVVNIPAKDVSEPQITVGKGGVFEQVLPGNDQFSRGDELPRPPGGQGQGSGGGEASDSGEGADDFTFEISRDEYLDLLFEELALPDLIKTKVVRQTSEKPTRAGFSSTGVPSNLNLVRTMRRAKGRRIAMSTPRRKQLNVLEEELRLAEAEDEKDMLLIRRLREEIASLKIRLDAVPFIDNHDLKFNQFIRQPKPTAQAVMFCMMDVSGSMTQDVKDIAKRFYMLLYLFLQRSYTKIDVVFIRHHSVASEVDEEEFFYSQETGGTVVSSALKLGQEIITDRYPPDDWNIYAAQASDGDNWGDDAAECMTCLEKLMPALQYFAYVEINQRATSGLWDTYSTLTPNFPNFAMRRISSAGDIYPVFHDLFKRREASELGRAV